MTLRFRGNRLRMPLEFISSQLGLAQSETPARPEKFGPAFAVEEPVSIVSPVVFASPHSGRLYPDSFRKVCALDIMALRRVEDAYVDRLISEVPQSGSPTIRALLGRAFIDLNRAEAEMDREMFRDAPAHWTGNRSPRVAAGLGCIPRIAHRGEKIYRSKLQLEDAHSRLDHVYRPYHQALDALLRRAQAMFGQCWLIDCHSMPSETPKLAKAADIILGDRYGAAADPDFVDFIEHAFRRRGYTTARNAPYAGGFATLKHGRPGSGRHAVQIEINRRLYLDEHEVEPHDGLVGLRTHLSEIAMELCEFTRVATGVAARWGGTAGLAAKEKAASDADAAKRY